MNNKDVNKRDVNIELIRVIACLIVIALHISLTYNINGVIDKSRLFIRSFLIDGVTLFWFIMGYFLFIKRNFKERLKHSIPKLLIPCVIVIIFTQIFYNWLCNTETLMECIHNFSWNIKDTVLSIIFLDISKIEGVAHLWYIFEYIKVLLWFPVVSLFCNNKKDSKLIRKYIIAIGIINILLNSTQFFIYGSLKYSNFIIGTNALIQVLIGYELYRHEKKLFTDKKNDPVKFGVIFFIIGCFSRFILQLFLFKLHNDMEYLMHTGRIVNLLSSLGIFLILKSVSIPEKFKKFILFFSSHTFFIYLVHYGVITKLEYIGFKGKVLNKFSNILFGELFFTISYTILVFSICLIISLTIKFILKSFTFSQPLCKNEEIK